jgi:hypothetical protein
VADNPWISPTKAWDECSTERQAQLRLAWGSGNLRWKLDPSQRVVYDDIFRSHKTVKSSLERVYCLDISRQSGKDFLMATIALETIYRRKGKQTRIPYAAPTKDNVHELLIPTFEGIFADCPPELRPYEIEKGTFRTNSPELTWPWGGRIVLVGVDLHPDWLRGPATYCFMFTEPAFVDNLDDVLEGVLLPQLLTQQEGFGILGSTPPTTPGHPWSSKYIPAAKTKGMHAKRVITECPRLSNEQIAGAIKAYGGMDATRCRRELFCEHIIESDLAIVPEFTDSKAKIVTEEPFLDMPTYRDTIVSIDPGFAHATGGLFAYMDFPRALLCIEGDFATAGLNSHEVAMRVRAREWQLWGRVPVKPAKLTAAAWKEELAQIRALFYPNLDPPKTPAITYRDGQVRAETKARWSDTNSMLIASLSTEHGLLFMPTEKTDMDVHVNALRLRVGDCKVRIHPRCVNLIRDLEQGTWNKHRTKFADSPAGGHFDCLAAAVYLNRMAPWNRNPFPPKQYDKADHHVPYKGSTMSEGTMGALEKAFQHKPRTRSGGRRR